MKKRVVYKKMCISEMKIYNLPPWMLHSSSFPNHPFCGSTRWLYHATTVPLFAFTTRFASWQWWERLNRSFAFLPRDLKAELETNRNYTFEEEEMKGGILGSGNSYRVLALLALCPLTALINCPTPIKLQTQEPRGWVQVQVLHKPRG